MRAIIDACSAQQWSARIAAVVSNRADAPALDYAQAQGIRTIVLEHQAFASRDAYDAALLRAVDECAPDLVVLAGFMRVLGAPFVDHYAGRLMNVHPSLLPSFAGLKTHQRALQAGVRVHGTTVHFVTSELDCGPIVAQAVVAIRDDDDAVSLAARVVHAEQLIYPRAVRWFVEGRLSIEGSRVLARLDPPESQWHFATECA
jgi:phosphoribosylglycinamide formyltransferase-1